MVGFPCKSEVEGDAFQLDREFPACDSTKDLRPASLDTRLADTYTPSLAPEGGRWERVNAES